MHFTTKSTRPISEEIDSARDSNVPYFPPPPTSSEASKTPSRQSKPPPLNGKSFRPPFTPRPRRRSSLRHTTGYPTPARKKRFEDVHLPAITLSPRQWTLVSLLLLSFLVLVIGFIFADCVALPHTDKQSGDSSTDPANANLTLYIRHAAADAVSLPSGGSSDLTSVGVAASSTKDISSPSNATTPAQYEADETEKLGFTSSKNLAILFFYTATLPFLTIFHTFVELTILFCCKKKSSTPSSSHDSPSEDSDSDSITGIKTLNLAKKHGLSSTSAETAGFTTTNKSRLSFLHAYLPALSLTTSILLTAGWIAINAIQAHCEIPLPSHSVDLSSLAATQHICPIQIRGHFMHGIHELSIVKNVFAWILVGVYIGYTVLCGRSWGMAGRKAREAQKLKELEGRREEQLRRSVAKKRGSVVRFSLGKKGDVGVLETTEEIEIGLEDERNSHGVGVRDV